MISRIASGWRILLTIVLGLALLDGISACAVASGASTPSPTPTPTTVAATSAVQRILEQAKRAKLTDATFTLSVHQQDPKTAISVTGSGIGTLTTTPLRFASTFSLTDGSLATEQVVDVPTKTTYLKFDQPPEMATKKFDKGSGTEGVPDIQQTLVYYHLTTATLVGAERINGVRVWHLHVTFPEAVI